MKGQSVFLTHTFLILFTVILLFVVFSTLSDVRDNQQEFMATQDAGIICSMVTASLDNIYQRHGTGYISINLPSDIGEIDYRGDFFENQLKISFGESNYSCNMPFNTSYTGKISGGQTNIFYNQSGVFFE